MKGINVRLKKLYQSRKISGAGIGEKVVLCDEICPLVFLCGDFAEATKIKRGLEGLDKKSQIIAVAREDNQGDDKNLLPFIEGVNAYINKQIDVISKYYKKGSDAEWEKI